MVTVMNLLFVVVGILAGLVVAGAFFKPFFGDMEGFMECFETQDMAEGVNPQTGGGRMDGVAMVKVGLWLALVGGAAYGTYYGLGRLFG